MTDEIEYLHIIQSGYQELIDGTQKMIDRIKQVKAELNELRKPKYSAKDFPFLDKNGNIIYFFDGMHRYRIESKYKTIVEVNYKISDNEIIDSAFNFVECKISDIKEGDYFAQINENYNFIYQYYFCKDNSDYNIEVDYGYDGYIKNICIPKTDNKHLSYVKFILKDKVR